MFEEILHDLSGDDEKLSPGGAFGRSNFVLPPYICPTDQGDLAFEKGLEQVRTSQDLLCCVVLCCVALGCVALCCLLFTLF